MVDAGVVAYRDGNLGAGGGPRLERPHTVAFRPQEQALVMDAEWVLRMMVKSRRRGSSFIGFQNNNTFLHRSKKTSKTIKINLV